MSEADRQAAVQNLLEFLEREDKEDSEERARYRGESLSHARDLFVVKEEMSVPATTGAPTTREQLDRKDL